ncbi:hypothetical protein BJ742DRAFT_821444 [Cladochytrium replicatum]|nr:hypothetical protein BJ742DRAFT_821444 [Cladochytrium replicatum]
MPRPARTPSIPAQNPSDSVNLPPTTRTTRTTRPAVPITIADALRVPTTTARIRRSATHPQAPGPAQRARSNLAPQRPEPRNARARSPQPPSITPRAAPPTSAAPQLPIPNRNTQTATTPLPDPPSTARRLTRTRSTASLPSTPPNPPTRSRSVAVAMPSITQHSPDHTTPVNALGMTGGPALATRSRMRQLVAQRTASPDIPAPIASSSSSTPAALRRKSSSREFPELDIESTQQLMKGTRRTKGAPASTSSKAGTVVQTRRWDPSTRQPNRKRHRDEHENVGTARGKAPAVPNAPAETQRAKRRREGPVPKPTASPIEELSDRSKTSSPTSELALTAFERTDPFSQELMQLLDDLIVSTDALTLDNADRGGTFPDSLFSIENAVDIPMIEPGSSKGREEVELKSVAFETRYVAQSLRAIDDALRVALEGGGDAEETDESSDGGEGEDGELDEEEEDREGAQGDGEATHDEVDRADDDEDVEPEFGRENVVEVEDPVAALERDVRGWMREGWGSLRSMQRFGHQTYDRARTTYLSV